ncbi:MAG TPA: hypothetical protein VHP35_09240 [Terriglobia bacterium]|nr:hypothetical protein [Terriglobia bacterium]
MNVDGFQLMRDHFSLPKDTLDLEPETKRTLTICNLFVNHKLSIGNIERLLDEDFGRVVLALLEHQILRDWHGSPDYPKGDLKENTSKLELRSEGRTEGAPVRPPV